MNAVRVLPSQISLLSIRAEKQEDGTWIMEGSTHFTSQPPMRIQVGASKFVFSAAEEVDDGWSWHYLSE
jgi:hypothetical protein